MPPKPKSRSFVAAMDSCAMFAVLQGQVLLAGAADATVWMWEALTGTCLQVFAGHEGSVTCGQFGYKKGKVHTHTHTRAQPPPSLRSRRVEHGD